ncbi:Gfo/Idh/MocA family oxidoreductase [Martelella alba]|uniref:Gfo/Idh/MocA family oxidoreductase n=1 Tax=Martelella alba TaxID=2590451 RepID=A0A506U7I6_9HYPH|nr:Gfo/Idh/MocA family oxidoreductase [Martelella alba]TPW29061.1 Gfo/Idh/MocA family oxidoreductase [Martelella alba]
MTQIGIAIVGFGKIARDQHLPAIAADRHFRLAGVVDPLLPDDISPAFASMDALLEADRNVDAFALCVPPHVRFPLAMAALKAGCHVLLEKPPATSLTDMAKLKREAEDRGLTLFTSWHSRFAPAAEPARQLLGQCMVRSATLRWNEDVRRWHPHQTWIWRRESFGVFDSGINGLALLNHILPVPLQLESARLVYPESRNAPIAAYLKLAGADGLPVTAEFDWRQTGDDNKTILIETDDGLVAIDRSGMRLQHNGEIICDQAEQEYATLYRHFAALIAAGQSDVDTSPLVQVTDAFAQGLRENGLAFCG